MNEKTFLAALIAVRDSQSQQTVGAFTFSPDNRMGRGFSYDMQQTLVDPLGCEPPRVNPLFGGMRNWPHTDAGMRRIAKRYAAANEAELLAREKLAA